MTDETHPNHQPIYAATPELFDRLFASTRKHVLAEQEAERRKAEWPGQVNDLLTTLARTVAAHEQRIAALEANLVAGRS